MKIYPLAGWSVSRCVVFVWLALVLLADGGRAVRAQGALSMLPPCPGTPNCVCSDDSDPNRRVDAFKLTAAPEKAWESLKQVVSSLPRVDMVRVTASELQAEVKSRLLRFVDDVTFQLRLSEKVIAVRSASRMGYYDMGVNRRRVEEIRGRLREMGVVE